MKTISSTNTRKYISALINEVREKDEIVLIERHGQPEAIILKFPKEYNSKVDFITNLAIYGGAFEFLKNEPDLYSINDLKNKYV